MVDTDRIGSQLLHECSVKLTLGGVHERVIFDELVGNTCAAQLGQLPFMMVRALELAFDEELVAVACKEFRTDGRDCWDGVDSSPSCSKSRNDAGS